MKIQEARLQNLIKNDGDGDKKDATTEFEHCVLCGRETSVRKNTHINHRIAYVEGVGQLCCKCALKLH